jgi:hypothetical protein
VQSRAELHKKGSKFAARASSDLERFSEAMNKKKRPAEEPPAPDKTPLINAAVYFPDGTVDGVFFLEAVFEGFAFGFLFA